MSWKNQIKGKSKMAAVWKSWHSYVMRSSFHVAGVDPDWFSTFYRNSVIFLFSPEELKGELPSSLVITVHATVKKLHDKHFLSIKPLLVSRSQHEIRKGPPMHMNSSSTQLLENGNILSWICACVAYLKGNTFWHIYMGWNLFDAPGALPYIRYIGVTPYLTTLCPTCRWTG